MKTTITRREILQFVGGSALGVMLSPLPWKVLDDSSIWTQNWPWTPKPLRGEISYRTTTCTLCQASCGMRARTVATQPISQTGVAHHPFSQGALCTTGILAHHLRYHPARLKKAAKFAAGSDSRTNISVADALNEIAPLLKRSSSVVIVDERPGRAVSALYREIASANRNVRFVQTQRGGLEALAVLSGNTAPAAGYDIENARFILSFGAPLLDGWGSPLRSASYFDKRRTQMLVQIEPVRSRTAENAGEWIAARPGTETQLALSIAHVLIEEGLAPASAVRAITDIDTLKAFLASFTPEAVAPAAGLSTDVIYRIARAFASQSPALAIAPHEADGERQAAVMLLNILAGSVGVRGGVEFRTEIPSERSAASASVKPALLSDVADHSADVIVLDESLSGSTIPDTVLKKKLKASGVIISLSPFAVPRPFAAQYVLPSTVVFETLTDAPGPFDSATAGLALSSALLPAPEGTLDALQFAQKLAEAAGAQLSTTGTSEEIVKKRITALHASKRGRVFSASSGESQEMAQLSSPDDLWSALAEGGCWMDTQSVRAQQLSFSVMPSLSTVKPAPGHDSNTILVVPVAEGSAYGGIPVSPVTSKLSQESGLRLAAHQASMNPQTAASVGIEQGMAMSLRTTNGTMNVLAKLDARTMPGVVFVSCAAGTCSDGHLYAADDIHRLYEVTAGGSYSPTPVTIQKAAL